MEVKCSMRIMVGNHIFEAHDVRFNETFIAINHEFYSSGMDTKKLKDQLLINGYADLTKYRNNINN